jgi:hypothetical protein
MLTLTDSQAEFNKKVMDEYIIELNKLIARKKDLILATIKTETRDFFFKSDTYESLTSGELRKHFGFWAGREESTITPIIDTFVNSLHYSFTPFTRTSGHFNILGVRSDFADVLSLVQAQIYGPDKDSIKTKYPLPWLDWLLKGGDKVEGYRIKFMSAGRSGGAIMVKGGDWVIPEALKFGGSATQQDNWVTRIFVDGDSLTKSYEAMLLRVLEDKLR